jgi:hypothetical protein
VRYSPEQNRTGVECGRGEGGGDPEGLTNWSVVRSSRSATESNSTSGVTVEIAVDHSLQRNRESGKEAEEEVEEGEDLDDDCKSTRDLEI